MQSLNDEEQRRVLGEVLADQLKVIQEGISMLPTRTEFNEVKDDIREIKLENATFKAAMKDLSRDVNDHERRITALEAPLVTQ
jgi:predicted nuclease with TOPRIM domain